MPRFGLNPHLRGAYVVAYAKCAGAVQIAPPGFIHPSRPTLSKQPPTGELWVHEVKHDGYRLQVHVRAGRVRLYTMNAADWTERYPRIVEEAARLNVTPSRLRGHLHRRERPGRLRSAALPLL